MARKPKSEAPRSRIALLREEKGWSQTEFADKLFTTQRAISDIERGVRKNLEVYETIAEMFDVSVDYLLGRTNARKLPDEDDCFIINLISGFSEEERDRIIRHIEVEKNYMSKSV